MLGGSTSPTLELARERAVPQPAPPPAAPVPDVPIDTGAAGTAFAVAISWLAAAALVVGIAWVASTLEPRSEIPADTLPYALAWSCGSLVTLVTSVGSLFVPARRAMLLATAAGVAVAMLAAAVTAGALG